MTGPKMNLHQIAGPEDGPDLLLIHGFGADRLSWTMTAPALAASRRVWAVDLPGHGETPSRGETTPADLAPALAEALHGKLPSHFAVVGHSLGGAIAMELAALLPERVSHLILIAPAGLGGTLDEAFLHQFPELHTEEATEALLHRLVDRPRLISRHMAKHILKHLATENNRDALRRIARALTDFAAPQVPAHIPTTLIWGEQDQINPLHKERLALLPFALHVLPDTGHMPQMEAPRKTNAIITEALGG